jgi:hypothetical protein
MDAPEYEYVYHNGTYYRRKKYGPARWEVFSFCWTDCPSPPNFDDAEAEAA